MEPLPARVPPVPPRPPVRTAVATDDGDERRRVLRRLASGVYLLTRGYGY